MHGENCTNSNLTSKILISIWVSIWASISFGLGLYGHKLQEK